MNEWNYEYIVVLRYNEINITYLSFYGVVKCNVITLLNKKEKRIVTTA